MTVGSGGQVNLAALHRQMKALQEDVATAHAYGDPGLAEHLEGMVRASEINIEKAEQGQVRFLRYSEIIREESEKEPFYRDDVNVRLRVMDRAEKRLNEEWPLPSLTPWKERQPPTKELP